MSWVVAFAFDCDFSLAEILERLRDTTDLTWYTRDSHSWGDYVSAGVGDDVIAKIFVEEPGYLLELEFGDDRLRASRDGASQPLRDGILPLLGPRNVRRAPANN